ncbi:MAG: sensor histidine kinase [Cyanobacteria bacterium J06627_28]
MHKAIQVSNHPFRFLLYLEWGLLTVAILSALERPPARPLRRAAREAIEGPLREVARGGSLIEVHNVPLISLIAIVLFGLMGLYLPRHPMAKIGHTLGQIVLVVLASTAVFNSGRTFPFVYLILVIRGCLMFGMTGRLLLTGTAFALFLGGLLLRVRTLTGMGQRLPPEAFRRIQRFTMEMQLNFVVLFGLSLLLVVLLINALLTERQSQHRLRQANKTLRESAQEIEKLAMDHERNRIARDIHDALGHSLTALNIQLESAVKLWEKDPGRAQQFLVKAKQLGTQSLQDVRQSVATLREDPLKGKTLEEAIAQLCQSAQTGQSLKIKQSVPSGNALPSHLKALLYRIVQEGLTNIVKHAQASEVTLQLTRSPAIVTLLLDDNGRGFDVGQASTGFGLQSMRDRAESAGGTFTLYSNSKGTHLQISLPIPTVPTSNSPD